MAKGGRGHKTENPAVGIGLSIPTSLRDQIEEYANRAGISRSMAIAQAIEAALPSMAAAMIDPPIKLVALGSWRSQAIEEPTNDWSSE
jgi:predicted NBD/HSP70 family sugar kinase